MISVDLLNELREFDTLRQANAIDFIDPTLDDNSWST